MSLSATAQIFFLTIFSYSLTSIALCDRALDLSTSWGFDRPTYMFRAS
jgi:hypothetical protein